MLTLLYHNVLSIPAEGLPVADHQVTIDTFRRHVHRFRGKLLHPLQVHDQLIRGKMPDGILISFDDGAAGIIEAGHILAEVGVAGVAFVCPGAVTTGLWFYRLADALAQARAARLYWQRFDLPVTRPVEKCKAYGMLSRELFDLPAKVRDGYLEEIVGVLQPPVGKPAPALTTLDEAGLHQAAQTGGLVLANHSWSHPNLSKLSLAELRHEVEAAQCWLEASSLPILPWFAFPRGYHDTRVREAVSQFCPVAFGAGAYESAPQVLPRTYVCELDASRVRFMVKTAWEGRLRRYFFL